jgi:hypothetical protein
VGSQAKFATVTGSSGDECSCTVVVARGSMPVGWGGVI